MNIPEVHPEPVEATSELLLTELRRVYWDAAEREIRHALLFYNDLCAKFPGPTNFENDIEPFRAENFEKIFHIWTGGQNRSRKNYDTTSLLNQAQDNARQHFNVPLHQRRARRILQSLSIVSPLPDLTQLLTVSSKDLLDIDIVHDYTVQFYPSYHQHAPLIEKFEPGHSSIALRGIVCGFCHGLVRSNFYYECRAGCQEIDLSPWLPEGNSKEILEPEQHVGKEVEKRLCPVCIAKIPDRATCSRDHYHRVQHHKAGRAREGARFQKRLSDSEDVKYWRTLKSRSFRTMSHMFWLNTRMQQPLTGGFTSDKLPEWLEMIFQQGSLSSITSSNIALASFHKILNRLSNHSTPAGLFHVALAFGPLTIENGISRTKGGAVISSRSMQPLLSTLDHVTCTMDDVENRQSGRFLRPRVVLFKDKGKEGHRHLWRDKRGVSDNGERDTLGSVKRVYGGLFSGQNALLDRKEKVIVETFLKAAVACGARPSISVRGRRKRVQEAGRAVVAAMHDLIDHEVERHLQRFSKILLNPQTDLTWNPRANSCQQFADKLLQGKDFDHLYPRFPTKFCDSESASVRESAEFPWPRYLLSFNDRIDGISSSSSNPNSIVSRFCKEDRDKCDLVEFARIAFADQAKEWEAGQSETERRQLVNEILLIPDELTGELVGSVNPDATMVNALWQCPRDSLSLLQTHIIRPYAKYSGLDGNVLEDTAWLENRLRVMQQLDTFACYAGGLGRAVLDIFTRQPTLLKELMIPHARVYGPARSDERIRIVYTRKLKTISYIVSGRHFVKKTLRGSKLVVGSSWDRLKDKQRMAQVTASVLSTMGKGLLGTSDIPSALFSIAKITQDSFQSDGNGWYISDFGFNTVALHSLKRGKCLRTEPVLPVEESIAVDSEGRCGHVSSNTSVSSI